MNKDNDYALILIEEVRDQNKAVLEAVGQLQNTVKSLATKDDLAQVETKVDTVVSAVKGTNHDLTQLDNRVTILEQAA